MDAAVFDGRFAIAGVALCAGLRGGCATTGEAMNEVAQLEQKIDRMFEKTMRK